MRHEIGTGRLISRVEVSASGHSFSHSAAAKEPLGEAGFIHFIDG